jgi:predicted unusual protein kinase regulating ubiquinone biosynthesis (AarF/ABC1/UbiB family)
MVNQSDFGSAGRRGIRLGKLGLSLTGSYLGYQVQNLFLGEEAKAANQKKFRQKASRRVKEELGSLKGPVMKLGQILGMQRQILPEEVLEQLAALQMQAPAMHPTLTRAQFRGSYGKYPEEVFREFEQEPFAAASLGQVHRAVTKSGQPVAVKIQYPGIRAAIENDLNLLRSATFAGRLTGHTPPAVIEEIRRGFLEETDYIQEGKHAEFFREALADFPYVSVPQVYWNLTTEKILTMSYLEGRTVGDFLKHDPGQRVRDEIGRHLVELYHFQIQCLHVLHADHQPGNYLFMPDGRIGLIDFGCVKRLKIDFADLSWCCVHRAWRQGEEQARHVLRLIWGPKVPIERAKHMLTTLENLVDILFPEPQRAKLEVDFGEPHLLDTMVKTYGKALRHKLTNPEFAFVSRTELGLVSLLHALRSRVNTREIWSGVHRRVKQTRSCH